MRLLFYFIKLLNFSVGNYLLATAVKWTRNQLRLVKWSTLAL